MKRLATLTLATLLSCTPSAPTTSITQYGTTYTVEKGMGELDTIAYPQYILRADGKRINGFKTAQGWRAASQFHQCADYTTLEAYNPCSDEQRIAIGTLLDMAEKEWTMQHKE
jgi:hypothetical protein